MAGKERWRRSTGESLSGCVCVESEARVQRGATLSDDDAP